MRKKFADAHDDQYAAVKAQRQPVERIERTSSATTYESEQQGIRMIDEIIYKHR